MSTWSFAACEGRAIAALPEIEKGYVDLLFALAEQ
jgi:hypothetical protein